jgi:hypothetical protein
MKTFLQYEKLSLQIQKKIIKQNHVKCQAQGIEHPAYKTQKNKGGTMLWRTDRITRRCF